MSMRWRVAAYAAFLASVWLVWSGRFEPLLILFGVISCGLVLTLVIRMDRDFPRERFWLRVLPRVPDFWLWLLIEIVKSNIRVGRIILSRGPRVSPTVVTIRAIPPDRLGQATLGNCITLTPGTVTLDDHEGELRVHCLTEHDARTLREGGMNQRVAVFIRS